MGILMGCFPHQLVGRSFRSFIGPHTNKKAIGRAMENAAWRNRLSESQDMLYELGGQARVMQLSFSPCFLKAGRPVCCLVTLTEALPNTNSLDSSAPLSIYVNNRATAAPVMSAHCSLHPAFSGAADAMQRFPSSHTAAPGPTVHAVTAAPCFEALAPAGPHMLDEHSPLASRQ